MKMRYSFLVAMAATVSLVAAAPANALKPSQTFVRPYEETIGFSNEDETCSLELHFAGIQIFRLYYDRTGAAVTVSVQGRTELTITNVLTGETISGFNSLNLKTTPFDSSTAGVGDVFTVRDQAGGLNAVLFPPKGQPTVLAGHITSELTFRVLVNDPETGEFEAELLSATEDATPHLQHLFATATALMCE